LAFYKNGMASVPAEFLDRLVAVTESLERIARITIGGKWIGTHTNPNVIGRFY